MEEKRVRFHAKKKVIKVIFKLASYSLNRNFYYKTEHPCYTNSFLIT